MKTGRGGGRLGKGMKYQSGLFAVDSKITLVCKKILCDFEAKVIWSLGLNLKLNKILYRGQDSLFRKTGLHLVEESRVTKFEI